MKHTGKVIVTLDYINGERNKVAECYPEEVPWHTLSLTMRHVDVVGMTVTKIIDLTNEFSDTKKD